MRVIVNPDNIIVKAIRDRLVITKGQCPCVPDVLWNKDTICPCKEFRETKHCHCQLYVSVED